MRWQATMARLAQPAEHQTDTGGHAPYSGPCVACADDRIRYLAQDIIGDVADRDEFVAFADLLASPDLSAVRRAIDDLPADERDVVRLQHLDGRPQGRGRRASRCRWASSRPVAYGRIGDWVARSDTFEVDPMTHELGRPSLTNVSGGRRRVWAVR